MLFWGVMAGDGCRREAGCRDSVGQVATMHICVRCALIYCGTPSRHSLKR